MSDTTQHKSMKQLIAAVRQHAEDNYNNSYGWSEVVECWTDQDLTGEIIKHRLHTIDETIKHFDDIAKTVSEHRDEIMSTAW